MRVAGCGVDPSKCQVTGGIRQTDKQGNLISAMVDCSGVQIYNLCVAKRVKGRWGGNPYNRKEVLNVSGKNLWGDRVVPILSKENQVRWGMDLKEKGRLWAQCGRVLLLSHCKPHPPQGHKVDRWSSASPGEMIVTNCWFSYESNTLLLEHKTFPNFNGSLKQFLAFGKWNIQEKQSRAIWRPRQYSRGIISGWGPCRGSQALGFQSWGWKVFIRTHWVQGNSLRKTIFLSWNVNQSGFI